VLAVMRSSVLFSLLGLVALSSFASFGVNALQCNAQWECKSVSENHNYNYVACVDGECVCRSEQGFTGAATVEDKCGCDDSVTWVSGDAFCIDIPATLSKKAQFERRRQILVDIYKAEIFQNPDNGGPIAIISNYYTGVDTSFPDRVFGDSVIGRIKEVGTVKDRNEAVDYFYGNTDFYGFHWSDAIIVHIGQSGEDSNILLSEIVLTHRGLTAPPPDGVPFLLWNITQGGHWRFNEQDQVVGYDLSIHQLGFATDRFDPPGPLPGLPSDNPFFGLNKTERYCTLYFTPEQFGGANCKPEHDPEGHYVDPEDCISFNANRPVGTWENVGMDSQTCMGYHVSRSGWNKLHCSHAGKTGGGKCFDHTPESYQADNEKYN
jgi:hypothetical protein